MSTPGTLRWWADQIRKHTSEFYFSHVLVADLNYGADEIEELESENAKLRQLALELFLTLNGIAIDKDGWSCYATQLRELGVEVDE